METIKLILDVGNTNIKLAFIKNEENHLNNFFQSNSIEKIIFYIKKEISTKNLLILQIIIGSTNMNKSTSLLLLLKKFLKTKEIDFKIYELNIENIESNLGFTKKAIKEIGIDLFALTYFFRNSLPCSIINFGTAISIISLKKETTPNILLLPGLEIAENALRKSAEKIPLHKSNSPTNIAINKGKVFLINSLIIGLLEKNRNEHNYSLNISGGDHFLIFKTLELNKKYKLINSKINSSLIRYKWERISINIFKQITLKSYWELWLAFYAKL